MPAPTTFVVAVPVPSYGVNEAYRNVIGAAGYFAANNVFSRLVTYDTGSPRVFGDLATSWEMSDDARTVSFRLNPTAGWQDGTALTAHDVAYTHLTAIEHGYHAASFLKDVADIEVLGDHEVRYHLVRPNAGFYAQVGNLVFAHILPKHLYEGTDWATSPYNTRAVGSGPFSIVEHAPERIVLEKWAGYWGVPAGVDRVVIHVEPDRDECVRMVVDGRAHYIVQDVLTLNRLGLVTSHDKAELWRKRGPGVAVLGFNHTQERWSDRTARLAVATAVNRANLHRFADPGYAEPWDQFFPGSVGWALADDARAPSHDPAAARTAAAAAGLIEGEPLRLVYLDTFFGHKGLAESVAADLGAIGVACEVAGLSADDWVDRVNRRMDFDLVVTGGNMVPDPEITASRFETGGQRNIMKLSNPDADACYEAARSTTNRDVRAEHYRRLQRVWARDVSWVPLFWYGAYYLRSRSFTGWSDQVGFSVPWWHWGRIHPVRTTATNGAS